MPHLSGAAGTLNLALLTDVIHVTVPVAALMLVVVRVFRILSVLLPAVTQRTLATMCMFQVTV
jgi:hypothetical protein